MHGISRYISKNELRHYVKRDPLAARLVRVGIAAMALFGGGAMVEQTSAVHDAHLIQEVKSGHDPAIQGDTFTARGPSLSAAAKQRFIESRKADAAIKQHDGDIALSIAELASLGTAAITAFSIAKTRRQMQEEIVVASYGVQYAATPVPETPIGGTETHGSSVQENIANGFYMEMVSPAEGAPADIVDRVPPPEQ